MDIQRLYRGIVDNRPDDVCALVTDDVYVAIPGIEGSGSALARDAVRRLHGFGTLRTWSADSADYLVSAHHAVVLDRWLAGVHDQHVTVLAAAWDGGRFGLLSIYGFDNPGIAKFFA